MDKQQDQSRGTFKENALRECEAMVEYAQSKGIPVPPQVLQQLTLLKMDRSQMRSSRGTGDPMRDYTSRSAEAPNVPSASELDESLAKVHAELSGQIQPATPSTVQLLKEEREKNGFWLFLGPVPLVRNMMAVTFFFLLLFLALFISPEVNSTTINQDILAFEGTKFLLNQLFIISIAALGASFYALFEAYRYISKGSYDPTYTSAYWIRFVLGIVSGVILAQFIGFGNASQDAASGGQLNEAFSGPLLAFLGGFSARVVHKILNRLVDSVESFVSGSAQDVLRAREQSAKVQMEEQVIRIRQESQTKSTTQSLNTATKLLKLQELINSGVPNELLKEEIKKLLDNSLEEAAPKAEESKYPPVEIHMTPEEQPFMGRGAKPKAGEGHNEEEEEDFD